MAKKNLATLAHDIEVLERERDILKLKLEQEEIYNSIQRYKLEKELEELKAHTEKIHGNTHAIGFHCTSTEETYWGDEEKR